MKKYKLIVFDLDGTLLHSLEGIGTAMNVVLDKYQYPLHDMEKYVYFVGNGLRKLVERALPREVVDRDGIEKYYQEMVAAYELHYQVGLGLYEGIADLLDHLKARGYLMAINSNKVDFMAKKIAEDYYQRWDWLAVIGARENIPVKPSPEGVNEIIGLAGVERDEVLYVGDSEVDLQTAQNAGVDSVFVSWGFRKPEDVAGLPISYTIHRAQDLKALLP